MRLGIIGTNFISDRIAEAAEGVKGLEVSAVYSRRADTGHAFADRHGIPHVFTDCEKMLTSGHVDALYIASPTMCHAEHMLLAALHGIPALCEKMLVALPSEMEDITRAVDEGAVVVEAMRPAFDRQISTVKKRLCDLGEIRRATLEYRQYSSRYDAFLAGEVKNAFDPRMKNSALADIGIYPLYLAVSLFGEPKDITASGEYLSNGFLASGEVELIYDSFSVTVLYSKIVEGENVSAIEGERGKILFDRINEPSYVTVALLGKDKETYYRAEGDSNIKNELLEFMRIANGDKRRGDELFATSAAVMRTVDRIYSLLGIHFD